eukprot:Clim_evm2s123 gene=Clim_evmTU2s123
MKIFQVIFIAVFAILSAMASHDVKVKNISFDPTLDITLIFRARGCAGVAASKWCNGHTYSEMCHVESTLRPGNEYTHKYSNTKSGLNVAWCSTDHRSSDLTPAHRDVNYGRTYYACVANGPDGNQVYARFSDNLNDFSPIYCKTA